MMQTKNRKLRLLAHLDVRHAASREMLGGVLRYAAGHSEWEVQFWGGHPSNEPFEYYRDWRPDALVTDGVCHRYAREEFAALAGRAVVFVNTTPIQGLRRPYAVLTTDERLLAVAAADLFVRKGLTLFAYVGTPGPERWSEARKRLFKTTLSERGYALSVFREPAATTWHQQEKALATWIRELPKPCGVWTAYDQRAKHVLDACHLAGVTVPDQVQILGVDNESYICEQTVPSLSSLAPDFEGGGFKAAEFLDNALAGRRLTERNTAFKFGLKGVVERLSTSDTNGTARRVAAAHEFIRRHAPSGIGVTDVAASLGVSNRLLEKNYRAVTGRTVIEDLQAERLAHVKEMLRKTTTPIDNIGPFCGFNSPSHLKTLFKRTFGMSMSEFRRG